MDIVSSEGNQHSLINTQGTNTDCISFEWFLENKKMILRHSSNIFQDMLLTMEQKKNATEANDCSLGIFFYRYVGYDDENSHFRSIESLHKNLLSLNNLYVFYNDMIPLNMNEDIISKLYSALPETAVNLQNIDFENTIKRLNLFNLVSNIKLNKAFETAFFVILKEYIKLEPGINISKTKNFMVKLLSWIDEYVKTLFADGVSLYNPKVVYYGKVKKHEGYFLMLLSQLGCDILVIEPEENDVWKLIDPSNKYSFQYVAKFKGKVASNPFNNSNASIVTKIGSSSYPGVLAAEPTIIVNLKKSIDIFTNIKASIPERGGNISGRIPIIPIYFYRVIGIEPSEASSDEFYNNIYNLDRGFKQGNHNYLRFIDQIQPPQNDEVAIIANTLDNIFRRISTIDENHIINEINKNRLLMEFKNKIVTNSFKYAFVEVLTLYLKNENTNLSIMKNFLAKLIVWINRYSKFLFKELPEDKYFEKTPKLLYYGEIKHAELYLLLFFSKTGCDVLYINSDHKADELFQIIDKEEKYTKLQRSSISIPLQAFPTEEKLLRKSTVAYDASVEIQELLFTPESGMYKPWQFQDFKTLPVSLKTTFDEISILWKENAVMRPNFSIANHTVYVPNIFAKINGVHENIMIYQQFVNKLKSAENTYFISKLPFISLRYTREDIFYLSPFINSDGTINRESLMKSSSYKYSYLKGSLQNFIIDKINELMKCDYFIKSIDDKFKLKILITALNLPEEILKLLQNFDYPHAVPKLVIYNNDKTNFNEDEVITLILLTLMGLDIIILAPTNYNNIENYIKPNTFDVHQLPKFNLNLNLNFDSNINKYKQIFSKLFKA